MGQSFNHTYLEKPWNLSSSSIQQKSWVILYYLRTCLYFKHSYLFITRSEVMLLTTTQEESALGLLHLFKLWSIGWWIMWYVHLKLRRFINDVKSEQIHKMTTIFTQNDNFVLPGQFWVPFFEFAQLYIIVFLLSSWDKSRDPGANWSKLEHM